MYHYKTILKNIFLIGLITVFQAVQTQSIYMSGRTNESGKHSYSKVIGENSFGVYVLKFRDYNLKKDFIIERFSADLNLLETQSYRLKRKEKVLKFILIDSFLHCLTQTNKLIEQYRIDFTLQKFEPVYKSINLPNSISSFDEIYVEYSFSKNYVSITIPQIYDGEMQQYSTVIRELRTMQERVSTIATGFEYRDCNIVSTQVTDEGKYSLLYKKRGRENRRSKEEFYWLTPSFKPSKAKQHFINPYKYLKSAKIYYHPQTKKSQLLALFNFGLKGGSQGIAIYNEDFPEESLNNPFQDNVITRVQGASALSKNKTVDNLFIRYAMPHLNGSYLVVLEKYYVSKEMERFYANGIPQASARYIYNYDDVILIQFDSTNQTSWSNIIHKKQSTMGSATYYSSFLFASLNKETIIVYNEKSNAENRLLMNKFTKDGKRKVQVLLEPSSNLMLGIPVEGKQVSYNSFILPVVNGRSQNLLKVAF